MPRTRKRFVHDPECALSQDWEGSTIPTCSCRERQVKRLKRKAPYRSGDVAESDFMQGRIAIGAPGCYQRATRYSE